MKRSGSGSILRVLLLLLLLLLATGLQAVPARPAASSIVRVGAGSYAAALPEGAAGPQPEVFRTTSLQGPMPTNSWWSSLAWMPYSERQYPLPLAVQEAASGLRVYDPGPSLTAGAAGVFGAMPPDGGEDLLLEHSAQERFPDARVDGFSDWFVRARFAQGPRQMTVSYGHGSPYVYARFAGGGARVRFGKPPVIWSGTARSAVLGLTANGRHYGLFAPSGSTWSGWGTPVLTNHPGERTYFALAVLPDHRPDTLALFAKCAYSPVTDTQVSWGYDERAAVVTTRFTFTTEPVEGTRRGTLFALFPHQWTHTRAPLTPYTYPSVRGTLKLAEGTTFTTSVTFPGLLPVLPARTGEDGGVVRRSVREELAKPAPGTRDTYWEGKRLGKLATLAEIAGEFGDEAGERMAAAELRSRLEGWFTATDPSGALKRAGLFAFDPNWGTLIGYPASFGSDRELNDHHFHYGYFIRAAAELARRDPAWAGEERWGGMVRLLIREIADPDRKDPRFPFLRTFDPYEGHSWASGHARFGDGNNNESSSEAMNAWSGVILWGEATGDRVLRDLGIYLYTTELEAIENYWFDVTRRNRPPAFSGATVAMVWGGKAVPATWFSSEPEKIHGINWLPFTGASLYLGRHPDYVRRNYDALVRETGGARWHDWASYVLMYEALADPTDALRQYSSAQEELPLEEGNSRANIDHWLHALDALGTVERSVTADYPGYAVFSKGGRKIHVAANLAAYRRTVHFSDGATLTVRAGEIAADGR